MSNINIIFVYVPDFNVILIDNSGVLQNLQGNVVMRLRSGGILMKCTTTSECEEFWKSVVNIWLSYEVMKSSLVAIDNSA